MKKKVLVFIVVVFYTTKLGFGQMEYEKAKFLYSLLKYIEWPDEINQGSFKIGVIGSFTLYKKVSDVTLGRKIGNLNIEVININRVEDLKLFKLHVLMIGNSKCTAESVKDICIYTDRSNTLVVGGNINSIKIGTEMSIYSSGSKLNFNMDRNKIVNKGILLSNHINVFARND